MQKLQKVQRVSKYKGYSLFNEVVDPALRTWNRCTVMLNANQDHGGDFVKGYAECMGDVERMQMMAMYQYIAVKGAEFVRIEIHKGLHSVEASEDKVLH